MPVASKFPLGFLGLVGAQNFGENPREIAYFVQPTIDIGEQYLVTSQELLSGSAGGAVAGFNAFIPDFVVPVGEVWRLLAFSVSVATGAGVSCTFGASVRPTAGVNPRMTLSDGRDIAASRTEWKLATAVPIWLPPGYQLGVEIQNLAGGNPGYSGQVIFSRLRA